MSDKAEVPETNNAEEGETRRRRSRPRKPRTTSEGGAVAEGNGAANGTGRSPRQRREKKEKTAAASDENKEKKSSRPKREPREPRERVPVPEELVGQTSVGKIADIIDRGRNSYGFVALENDVSVYFKPADFADASDFKPRRGYEVEITCAKDDKERVFANAVKLTAAGRSAAAEREAKIAADKANSADATKKPRAPKAASAAGDAGEGEAKPKRERKPRRPEDDRSVTLNVTSANSSETKTVVAVMSQSIGKLKHAATEAFEAPVSYNVYHNGELLTKATLRTLSENDTIHIKEPAVTA
jgi:hypothetical protein